MNRALDDENLQQALIHAMSGLRGRRNVAFETFDFKAGQAELKRRRQANLDRLPELVEQFTGRSAPRQAMRAALRLATDNVLPLPLS